MDEVAQQLFIGDPRGAPFQDQVFPPPLDEEAARRPQEVQRGPRAGRGRIDPSSLECNAAPRKEPLRLGTAGSPVQGVEDNRRHGRTLLFAPDLSTGLTGLLSNPFLPGLLKKAQMQGGAGCAGYPRKWVEGVLGPYVAIPRDRTNAPPAAAGAAGRMLGLFQRPAAVYHARRTPCHAATPLSASRPLGAAAGSGGPPAQPSGRRARPGRRVNPASPGWPGRCRLPPPCGPWRGDPGPPCPGCSARNPLILRAPRRPGPGRPPHELRGTAGA